MIYLYGLMDPGAASPEKLLAPLSGVTGSVNSRSLDAGRLIYGDHDGSEITAKRRLLLAHTKVLEHASSWATVLPMRFGMMADDIGQVAAMITSQKTAIETQFGKLNGHVEYGVRVAFPEAEALAHILSRHPDLAAERDRLSRSTDYYGKAEFGRKLGETLERQRTNAQRALVGRLQSNVADLVLRVPESAHQVLHAHVLLRAEDEPTFPDILSDLTSKLDFAPGAEAAISLVGPTPLYNFVRLNLAASSREAA